MASMSLVVSACDNDLLCVWLRAISWMNPDLLWTGPLMEQTSLKFSKNTNILC